MTEEAAAMSDAPERLWVRVEGYILRAWSRTGPVDDADIEYVRADTLAVLEAENKRLREALSELHALVWGECPSLLNEDSGGAAYLDDLIRAALDPQP